MVYRFVKNRKSTFCMVSVVLQAVEFLLLSDSSEKNEMLSVLNPESRFSWMLLKSRERFLSPLRLDLKLLSTFGSLNLEGLGFLIMTFASLFLSWKNSSSSSMESTDSSGVCGWFTSNGRFCSVCSPPPPMVLTRLMTILYRFSSFVVFRGCDSLDSIPLQNLLR